MATYRVCGVGQPGKYFDDRVYNDTINYVFDPDSAAYIGGAGIQSLPLAAEEMRRTAVSFGKDKGKRVRHSVLSFDESESVTPEQANGYAREIIQHYAPEYQIVFAVHTNTDNVHVHFVMNQVAHTDGHRYEGKKKDFYDFRRHMARVTHLPILLVKDSAINANLNF